MRQTGKDSFPKGKGAILIAGMQAIWRWLELPTSHTHFHSVILTHFGHQGIEAFLIGMSLWRQFSRCVSLNLFIVQIWSKLFKRFLLCTCGFIIFLILKILSCLSLCDDFHKSYLLSFFSSTSPLLYWRN